MARKPAVQIICDRTGEEAVVQIGVTLENMNESGPDSGPALDLTFRPLNGEAITVKFDDLCARSDAQVKLFVDAIKDSGYFMLVPIFNGDGDVGGDTNNQPDGRESAQPAEPTVDPPAVPKRSGRRTHAEIEKDDLDAAVEAASSLVDKKSRDPEAAGLDVADARETLKDALQIRAYFASLSPKEQKKYTSAARAVRKAGGQPARPANLPDIDPAELERYGLLDVSDDVSDDDHVTTSDDDDIFGVTTPGTDEPEQTDFL
jgi:hypothetical protein